MTTVSKLAKPAAAAGKVGTMRRSVYLDNHATTPVDPQVLEAMLPYLKDNFGNAASTHSFGIRAAFAVEKARTQVATAMHAQEGEIFFTAGATESNNLVIKGVFDHYRDKKPHFIVSSIEHKCILESAKHIEKLGAEVTFLPVTDEGFVEPEQLKKAIRPNTVLVSVMFANNEIGTINPVRELAAICHEHNILFHTDAAQAIGKIPVDVEELGIDMLSASGHKFYAPKGIGFVYIKNETQALLTPLLNGGGQEDGMRSGTLNVPGIVALGKAIELATEDMDISFWHYVTLRNQLYDKLVAGTSNLMLLNGPEIPSIESLRKIGDLQKIATSLKRLPHNLNVSFPSIDASTLRQRLNRIAFSAGSACSSAHPEPSYVLTTIGRTPEEAFASMRFGIGRFNNPEEVTESADAIAETVQSLS